MNLTTTLRSAVAGLLLTLTCTLAWSQTDPATAERLLRRSGLWSQLEGMAPRLRAGMAQGAQQGGRELSAEETERLGRAVDVAYAAPRLRSTAMRSLTRHMPPEHVDAVEAWFASPVGAAITKMEESASDETSDPTQKLKEGAARLQGMASDRRALLRRIMQLSKAAETGAAMAINTALGVRQGLRSVRPDAPGPSEEEVRSMLEAQRPRMEQAFSAMAEASAAMVYEAANDEQLTLYARFLDSPPGRQFTDVVGQALDAVFLEAATVLGRAMPGTRDGSNT
jgi:hypothetical protein